MFAGNYVPKHFIPCNGQLFKRADYPKLSKLIGTEYGGDAEHFGTPNLPNVDDHAQWLMNAKSMRDYNDSIYPSGSIILGLKTLNPKGFKPCNGQLLPLNNFTNEILFANIGTSLVVMVERILAYPITCMRIIGLGILLPLTRKCLKNKITT